MIEVCDTSYFDIKQICTCGQLFRYVLDGDNAIIHTKDKEIVVKKTQNGYKIFCDSDNFAKNYFDLDKNYAIIHKELKTKADNKFFNKALDFGKGIRILQQDSFEMIISFIISQNNNIPRIQKSIETMCKKFGKSMGSYYAFPTLSELEKATIYDLKSIGLGYRASYIVETVKALKQVNYKLEDLQKLNTKELKAQLLQLKGVGPKVADCILLFGFKRFDAFPADTWIKQLYVEDYGQSEKSSTNQVSEYFVNKFKALSGYAQQYLYYYKRENK